MNKRQENEASMLRELLRFSDGYAAELSVLPNFVDSYAKLKALYAQLEAQMKDQIINVKAHTQEKEAKRIELVNGLQQEADRLSFLAEDSSAPLLQGQAKVTKSGVGKLRDTALLNVAAALYDVLDTQMALLAPYSGTAATLAAFKGQMDAYRAAIDERGFAFNKRLAGTRGIEGVLVKSKALVARYRKIVRMSNNPELVAKFEDAARVDKLGIRHYALHGVVMDDEDGAAVQGAKVSLFSMSGEVLATVTSELGGYHFKSVSAGLYKLHVEKRGFFDYDGDFEMLKGKPQVQDLKLSFDNSEGVLEEES